MSDNSERQLDLGRQIGDLDFLAYDDETAEIQIGDAVAVLDIDDLSALYYLISHVTQNWRRERNGWERLPPPKHMYIKGISNESTHEGTNGNNGSNGNSNGGHSPGKYGQDKFL